MAAVWSTSDARALSAAAADFGLATDPATCRSVDADAARALLSALLRLDLAYRMDAMQKTVADRIAESFVEVVGPDARFFTNGLDPSEPDPQGWNPATTATFDTGILAVTATGSACLWVEDED